MSDSQSSRRIEQRPRWWWPLRAHSRGILLAGLPVALIIALMSLLDTPIFESRTLLEVQAGSVPNSVTPNSTEITVLMNTQREIVSSATVAGDYRYNIRVEVVPQTYLLSVHFQDSDPQRAQLGAKAVAQAYVDYTADAQLEQIKRAAAQFLAKLDSVTMQPNPVNDDVGDESLDSIDDSVFDDLLPPLQNATGQIEQLRSSATQASSVLEPGLENTLIRQLVKTYDDSLNHLVSATVLDEASLPRAPLEQMQPWWILLGYLSAVAVPAFVVAMRFQRRDSLDFKQDVEKHLGKACVGVIPALNLSDPAQFLTDREYAGNIGVLRARLQMLRPVHDPLEQFPRGRVVLLTSSNGGEGKSAIAMNLAFAMAKTEKVLLINADMRKAQTYVGIPASAAGLSHLIAGAAQMRDCVHGIAGKDLFVIPSGVLPPNPHELLSSKRFQRVLEMLERRFDTIIIDAPALGEVSDTLVVARHCSDVLFVVQAGLTKLESASIELARLQGEGIPPVRVVLNRVQPYELDLDFMMSLKR